MEVNDKVYVAKYGDPTDLGIIISESRLGERCWLIEFPVKGTDQVVRIPYHEDELVLHLIESICFQLGECCVFFKDERCSADVSLKIYPGGACRIDLLLPPPRLAFNDFNPSFIVPKGDPKIYKFENVRLEEASDFRIYRLIADQVYLASKFAKFEIKNFESVRTRSEVSQLIQELL